MCADCHSHHNAKGEFIADLWLQGGPIPFKPTIEMPAWAEAALPIAGLPTIPTDEEAVLFLTKGHRADGRRPRPPMPEYRETYRFGCWLTGTAMIGAAIIFASRSRAN
jgi:hypothetical protein